jgi:hypothetical protein
MLASQEGLCRFISLVHTNANNAVGNITGKAKEAKNQPV